MIDFQTQEVPINPQTLTPLVSEDNSDWPLCIRCGAKQGEASDFFCDDCWENGWRYLPWAPNLIARFTTDQLCPNCNNPLYDGECWYKTHPYICNGCGEMVNDCELDDNHSMSSCYAS